MFNNDIKWGNIKKAVFYLCSMLIITLVVKYPIYREELKQKMQEQIKTIVGHSRTAMAIATSCAR